MLIMLHMHMKAVQYRVLSEIIYFQLQEVNSYTSTLVFPVVHFQEHCCPVQACLASPLNYYLVMLMW